MAERPSGKTTFDVLNGLRGIAAIAVVNMHMSTYFGVIHSANVAPAVDFFFVLSGFVISYAYEEKLTSGMLWSRFFIARIIRLYPLYLIGLILGSIVVWFLEHPINPERFFATLGLNLFMLPNPVAMDANTTPLFPINFPAWSLFVELVANLAYAALAPRLSNRLLTVIVCAGFLGLVATGMTTGTLDEGTQRLQILGGLARVTFSFFAGVALYRQWRVRPTNINLHPALLFVLLILPLMLKPAAPFGWLYELAVLTLYMPAIVWLGSGSRPIGVWLSVSVALGALSYPLYMIHAPVWIAIRTLEGWQPTSVLIGYAPWSGIAMTAGLCAVAWWLDKAIDYPLRRRLYKTFLHRLTHAADPEVERQRR
ncbi:MULTISPECIES: acyltransferase [unclassified Sphingomonas]|uniref:acyltransferase family protein n=1 Tax=unclassified Sphingomonas TaxID=196159 RepID=UPI00226ACEAB|nr:MULTISPECIES: acyltransferase [unclassified Sphingomonas]